ncbi:hypothetical protein ACR3IL_09035 [Streptococcus iniae]|uniref:hypothetical protein n=1 Tax=Streptococcus agalactiae TaxID=1311 RepID=UPI0008DAE382|nr:hypothetical protein [Streptococcus agalactiae]ELY5747365.1 hypothetical protein [Streptococcus iniae]KAF0052050.1 hypothetical protein GL192_00790 [Streptococcus agalactiae]OHX26614.1 hypothetical protein BKX95_09560 [Streptococcus iniae]
MEMLKTVITALGGAATIIGLFGVFNGWQTFIEGKETGSPQHQKQGEKGMIYGGMLAAGSATIAAGIVLALSNIRF